MVAVDDARNTGASEASSFAVAVETDGPIFQVPAGVSPLETPAIGDAVATARPTFSWTEAKDPSGVTYNLEVSQSGSGDFSNSNLVVNRNGLTGDTRFKPDVQLPGGILSWRVIAVDGAGNTSDSLFGIFSVVETPDGLTAEFSFGVESGDDSYMPTFEWDEVLGAASYEVSLDNGSFHNIGTGDPGADPGKISYTIAPPVISGDSIEFGTHHVLQIVAIVTGSTLRGGFATLFFIDDVTTGGTATSTNPLESSFTVDSTDFLPLGEFVIQISGEDRLKNTGDPRNAELLFNVSQLAISLVDPDKALGDPDRSAKTVQLPAASTTLNIQVDPRGVEVDGAEISIDVVAPLQFGALISAGAGVVITSFNSNSTTADLTATFDIPRTDEFTLATIQINTPTAIVSPVAPNVLLVDSGDRRTIGRFENRDISAVLTDATITVQSAPVQPPFVPPPPPLGNQNPVAVVGPAQTVDEGSNVALDASASNDQDDAPEVLTFSWTQVAGPPVNLNNATSAIATFDAVDNGIFVFEVTVSDDGDPPGQGTATTQVTVSNVAPAVQLSGVPPDARVNEDIDARVVFTDPGILDTHVGTIDWGDNSQTDFNPAISPLEDTHTYDQSGNFNVVTTVTDKDGGVGTASQLVVVSENEEPVADAGDAQTVPEGTTVLFSGLNSSDSDGQIVTYEWDFDDGDTDTGPTVSHEYGDDDVFTVTLTVTDDEGAQNENTVVITVENVAPTVRPGDDQATDEGSPVRISFTFDDVGLLDTHSAVVNWSDNSTTNIPAAASPETVFHGYDDDGIFTVTISVTDDDGGTGSGDLTVTVSNVDPDVDAGADQSAFADDTVILSAEFDDSGTGDTHTATIYWGDGTVESGDVTEPTSPGIVAGSHVYATAGVFTVSVTVRDDNGGVDTDTLQVQTLTRVGAPAGIGTQLSVSTNRPIPPETVGVLAVLTNTTGAPITINNMQLLVNRNVDFIFPTFTVPANQSIQQRHIVNRRLPNNYAVQVFGQVENFVISGPLGEVVSLSSSPRLAGAGNTVVNVAGILNAGSLAGTITVPVRIDGTTFQRDIFLRSGQIGNGVVLVPIPSVPPSAGIASPGIHSVRAGTRQSRYEVARRDISTEVRRSTPVNSLTTKFRAPDGTEYDIGTTPVNIGSGSITITVPAIAPVGATVSSFVDTTSGVSITQNDVRLPVRDPDTNEVILRLQGVLEGDGLVGVGNAASAIFKSLNLITQERRRDLSDDDPNVGRLGVSFNAGLDSLPEGVRLDMTVKKELSDEDRTHVEIEARQDGKVVANQAAAITVQTTNLDSEADINDVTATLKVSSRWINIYGRENVRIAHVGDDGTVELLVPECTGPDAQNEFTCVGTTTRGFSEFSLLALTDVPPAFTARNLVVTPDSTEPGETVQITVDILNEGVQAGSFSAILKVRQPDSTTFDPVAVKEITLQGGEQGTVSFFVLREEQGQYDVEIEGREGEILQSAFSVFRKIEPALLSFTDLVVPTEDVIPGDPITIRMFVTNAGEADGRTEIEFRINEVLTELRSLSVPGRGRVEVLFEFIPPAEGTFDLELIDPEELVSSLTGTIRAVSPIPPAEFEFGDVEISRLEVFSRQSVTVTVPVVNLGEEPGVMVISVVVDDDVVASQELTLEELSGETLEFTFEAPEELGEYLVIVEGLVTVGAPDVDPVEVQISVVESPIVIEQLTTPEQVRIGDLVTITVEVVNDSNEQASRTLRLSVADVVVEERYYPRSGPDSRRDLRFPCTHC